MPSTNRRKRFNRFIDALPPGTIVTSRDVTDLLRTGRNYPEFSSICKLMSSSDRLERIKDERHSLNEYVVKGAV